MPSDSSRWMTQRHKNPRIGPAYQATIPSLVGDAPATVPANWLGPCESDATSRQSSDGNRPVSPQGRSRRGDSVGVGGTSTREPTHVQPPNPLRPVTRKMRAAAVITTETERTRVIERVGEDVPFSASLLEEAANEDGPLARSDNSPVDGGDTESVTEKYENPDGGDTKERATCGHWDVEGRYVSEECVDSSGDKVAPDAAQKLSTEIPSTVLETDSPNIKGPINVSKLRGSEQQPTDVRPNENKRLRDEKGVVTRHQDNGSVGIPTTKRRKKDEDPSQNGEEG